MRVIAGKVKGLTLAAPPGLSTRPTSDRMKEDLFNIAARFVPGADVLDLYAGSGALGIEALSRGAERCVFVEHSKRAAAVLRKNIAKAGFVGRAQVLVRDVQSALTRLDMDFSLIFLDPPYDYAQAELPGVIAKLADILRPGAVIIAETRAQTALPDFARLNLFRQKLYSQTKFMFWEKLKGV